jgi:hypothetical protein
MKVGAKRRFLPIAPVVIAIVGLLTIGWVIPFLPGRVTWLHYSLPAGVTKAGNETSVSVPSEAGDSTTWSVETILGSSPRTDEYKLKVTFIFFRQQIICISPPHALLYLYRQICRSIQGGSRAHVPPY